MKKQLMVSEIDQIITELETTAKTYWKFGFADKVLEYQNKIEKYQKMRSEIIGKAESTRTL